MVGRTVRWQLNEQDKVGGVTGGGQCAAALTGLVQRGLVGRPVGDVLLLNGLEPDLRGKKGGDFKKQMKPITNLMWSTPI